MTKEEFAKLAGAGVILLDGATGSNLTKAGMPKGISTEIWTLEHADILIGLQKAYLAAGSQIIYAPTFSANRISLSNFGYQNRVEELNTRLAALSKEAVGNGNGWIAGDITTTGKMMEPKGELTYEELYDAYAEQITALANAGVDLLVAETMMCVDETCVVLDAAAAVCDLPVMCSLTLEADGSALFGGNAVEAVETLQEMGAAAVGLNCSVGPDQLEAVVRSMAKVARVPVIAKPNAGLPVITPTGEAFYSMNAEDYARHMKVLVDAGAGVIGGCCGTTPEYIRLLAEMLGRADCRNEFSNTL
ncbi:homocysteine S-methyltransferase family protein [Lacrimispora saccharolytica]|nr:homocysteine S-methyltransferase family protein [Lacrimispora saccharolytica]